MSEPITKDAATARSSRSRAPARDGDARRTIEMLLESPDLHRPVFQPIVSLASGSVVGYEALSRFAIEPVRSPELWFAEADRVGLGVDVEALVIRRILAAAALAGIPDQTFLSLNVSPRHLADPRIEAAVSGADPASLVLEITEHEQVGDYVALRRAMAPFVARGVRFAIDDTGAGFASMRHVTELGPAFVKLDADLVRGMRSRATLQAFLRALDGFTREIGATLVAEGVERISDLAVLTLTGFPLLVQGYAIARPGAPWPAASELALQAWLAASAARPTHASAASPRSPAIPRRRDRSAGVAVTTGVNIGVLLAASLHAAGIDTLEALRMVGAVAAWRRVRAVTPEIASHRTLLALEGAIRGVRWVSLPRQARQDLIRAAAADEAPGERPPRRPPRRRDAEGPSSVR